MTTPAPQPKLVLGQPSATRVQVGNAVRALSPQVAPWFFLATEALWVAGVKTGIDPVALIAQCAHETGWGAFGRAVTASHGNTAGIKVRDVPPGSADNDPNIHARFATDPTTGTPWVGALAHAHHLGLYAGRVPPLDTPDPRAVWVWVGKPGFGTVRYVRDLGGKWAPALDYGQRIEATMNILQGLAK